jgi:hypothetical protein
VFSLMASVFSCLIVLHCLPWRRQATASKTEGSTKEACVGLLRQISSGCSPQEAILHRPTNVAFSFGSTVSLENLMDLIGSDGESKLDLSATIVIFMLF